MDGAVADGHEPVAADAKPAARVDQLGGVGEVAGDLAVPLSGLDADDPLVGGHQQQVADRTRARPFGELPGIIVGLRHIGQAL